MNNREFLIEILLKLRSIGVKNQNILESIEKLPPHYYMSFFKHEIQEKKIGISELIEISKLLDIALSNNNKLNNILLSGFKNGWFLALLTDYAKRIYGVCSNEHQKRVLKKLYIIKNYSNIYLNTSNDIFSWKNVAPFDFIFSLDANNLLLNKVTKYLSAKGIAIIPQKKRGKSVKMIAVIKDNSFFYNDLSYDRLIKSDLI